MIQRKRVNSEYFEPKPMIPHIFILGNMAMLATHCVF